MNRLTLKWVPKHFFCKKKSDQNCNIQQQHVYKVYDKIAEHFSQTRYKPWPKIAHFMQHLKKGSIVLDIGCGNGRNMGPNKAIEVIGLDRCIPLLNISKNKQQNNNLVAADALKLPIRSQSCDAFICIALLHHFSSRQMRIRAYKQFSRILKKGGEGLIYVRAMQIINDNNELVKTLEYQDFFVPWHLQLKYEKNLEQAILKGYKYIPQKNSVIYERFYHVFAQGELQDEIRQSNSFQIKQSFYDNSNWVSIVRKA